MTGTHLRDLKNIFAAAVLLACLLPAGMAQVKAVTLYDLQNGFFIPNDRKRYSVGENGGMELNSDGGIEIYIAPQKPDGVPKENWLPINRKDEDLSVNLRIYVPDQEKMKTWKAPSAVLEK